MSIKLHYKSISSRENLAQDQNTSPIQKRFVIPLEKDGLHQRLSQLAEDFNKSAEVQTDIEYSTLSFLTQALHAGMDEAVLLEINEKLGGINYKEALALKNYVTAKQALDSENSALAKIVMPTAEKDAIPKVGFPGIENLNDFMRLIRKIDPATGKPIE